MQTEKTNNQPLEKKIWQQPELTAYGSVEKITLAKGFGISDGSGLSPKGVHPSM